MTTSSTKAASILVLDDNDLYRLEVEMMLSKYGYDLWLSTSSPELVIDNIRSSRQKPDLMLLDIRLQGSLDGIAVADMLSKWQIPIIFFTAHPEEAQFKRALAFHPSAYLLKPVPNLELHHAIQVALASSTQIFNNPPNSHSGFSETEDTQITVRDTENVLHKVSIAEIYAVESYGNLLLLHGLGKRRFIIRKTMKEIEDEWKPHRFIRIHRRFLISLAFWERKKPLGNELIVASKPFPLGRSYRKDVQHYLLLY